MTNDLDRLLEQVEDALADGGDGLWQPDLTSPVLPGLQEPLAQEVPEGTQAKESLNDALTGFSALEQGQALPRFLRAEDESLSSPGQSGSEDPDGSQDLAAQPDSPALLEQLQTLENTQASVQALGRSQGAGSILASRSLAGQGGGGISYDPAALGDFPLAAAAAAAQEEDRARAVDRAFQRDSRRYDRGFSLY